MAAEYLRRALLPRLVVGASALRGPRRLRARLKRALGGKARIELYFAFDDPYSAVALPGLIRIAQRHAAELEIYPLVQRGIPGDPAADKHRVHALADARRLAQRHRRELARREPLPPEATAFLAAWAESARGVPGMVGFAAAALDKIWLGEPGPLAPQSFAPLFRETVDRATPTDAAAALPAVEANYRRLLRKGHWESPAVRVEGEWFFAHERLAQIEERLNELGW